MNSGGGRQERRYNQPAYPLQEVVALARRHFVDLTIRASNDAAKYFGDEIVSVKNEVVNLLKDLSRDEWRFCQEKDGEWVDVYRVGVYENFPDAWVKLKIERPKGYQAVIVISFHEWDDDR